jgi:hypothetical protein
VGFKELLAVSKKLWNGNIEFLTVLQMSGDGYFASNFGLIGSHRRISQTKAPE